MPDNMQACLSTVQPLMLVADTRGRVCHATRKLSELLGRPVEQLKGNGADHALSSLLPEPFGQLHRSLAQVYHCLLSVLPDC
jgi:hypothetical protein